MPRFRRLLLSLAALAFVAAASTSTRADTTIIGTANPTLATATIDCMLVGNTFTFTITNTSPFDARITAIGFDVDGVTNLSTTVSPQNGFAFATNLTQVPQFSGVTLDFGFITGSDFGGGNPNAGIAPGASATFIVTGDFGGLTADQICNAVFVRFQRVGPTGQLSDVGTANPIPEPMTMILFGTGLAGVAGAARRKHKAQEGVSA